MRIECPALRANLLDLAFPAQGREVIHQFGVGHTPHEGQRDIPRQGTETVMLSHKESFRGFSPGYRAGDGLYSAHAGGS